MFPNCDVLTLESLLFLGKVTSDIRWQLLHHRSKESCVSLCVSRIGVLTDALLNTEAEGPTDAVRWCFNLDDAGPRVPPGQVESLWEVCADQCFVDEVNSGEDVRKDTHSQSVC